jgi:uncharacterized RDD family membrane protein YckC
METVYCGKCNQLNTTAQTTCLYCDEPLPAPPPVDNSAPPARPYFANDPAGPSYPAPAYGQPQPPPPAYRQPTRDNYPGASPAPEPGYYAPPYAPQPSPYAAPNQPYAAPYAAPPAGYQGVDAFGLPSYSAYSPPQTQTYEIADRWTRLGASLLDGLAAIPFVLAPMFIGVMLDGLTDSRETFQPLFTFLGYILYLGVYIYYLTTEGATIGKKALGIRIVKADTLENGGFVTNFLMRVLVPVLLGAITCNIFTLVDILFIFGQDQKCLHDQMAGTIVIKKEPDYLRLN